MRRFPALMLAAGLSACSWQEPVHAPAPGSRHESAPQNSVGEEAAAIALRQLGVPYRYGGSSPSGFDCSGLVHYSYRGAGKSLPRTTAQLWGSSEPVARTDIRVGDLLFFRVKGKVSHVGLYIGGDRFVHAPSSGRSVSVETLGSDYYRRTFIGAGRPR